jgi:hypothetical protein
MNSSTPTFGARIRSVTPAWERLAVTPDEVEASRIELEWLQPDEVIVLETEATG